MKKSAQIRCSSGQLTVSRYTPINTDNRRLWDRTVSLDENRRRAATTGDRRPSQVCRRPSPVLDCQEPATAVAGRRRFNAQRKTEFSSVQFSFPLCIELKTQRVVCRIADFVAESSHLRCRWTNDMELVPKQFAWTGHANWLFSSYTEDVSFWSVLGTLSALEALFATMRYINWHLHYITLRQASVVGNNVGSLNIIISTYQFND